MQFKDFCKVRRGASPRPIDKHISIEGIPWIKISDATDGGKYINNTKEFIKYGSQKYSVEVNKGDLIVTNSGTPGVPKISNIYGCVHDGWLILSDFKTCVSKEYIYYWLLVNKNNLVKQGNGSIFINLKKEILETFEINLPDRATQDKIVEILSNIDNQIERNNEMTKRLQVLAQSTYSRWFNQFEFPNEENLPYKSNGGKLEYNEELKREIPIGWEAKELLDLIEWKSSSQPPKSDFIDEYKKGYIRFIQNRDYDSSSHLTYIPLTANTKTCTKYDIMIDKYGDAGRTRYGLEGAYNVALAKIEPKYNNQQELIRKYLEQDSVYTYLNNACIASTRASLNELVLQGLKIIVPTESVLIKFETMMKSIINEVLDITKSTQELNNLKSKLLPLLINGQLEV